MMNVEIAAPSQEENEAETWVYVAKNRDDKELRTIRKEWQDFLRDTRAARREGKAVPCPGCQALVHPHSIYYKGSICHFCDRHVHPYMGNPRNRDLFNRFIAPELKKRGIANPFA